MGCLEHNERVKRLRSNPINMGRHKKGKVVKRTDVWAEAGGKEAVVFQFLKADILNREQGYSSDIWSDVSIALFGEDTRKNRHWLWVIWTNNRNGVRDQLTMNHQSEQTTLEPGDIMPNEGKLFCLPL